MKRTRLSPWATATLPTVAAARRGSVLLWVLVVVVIVALGAYSYTELMVLERESAVLYGRDAQARAFADSGLEQVMALLGTRAELQDGENFYHDPLLFQAHLLVDDPAPRARLAAPARSSRAERPHPDSLPPCFQALF